MQQTLNYGLPQFNEEDLFSKDDFNNAFEKIDNAISEVQDSVNILEPTAREYIKDLTFKIEESENKIQENKNLIENGGLVTQGEKKEIISSLEQKAKQIDLEIERERINNLAKLNQGSTTGDAELIDGRIGLDGITYKNIGEAIRGQNKKTNNFIKDLETLSEILPISVEDGRWGSDATLVQGDSWKALKYSVTEGKDYYINGYALENATYKIFFVDNLNKIISKIEDYQVTQPLIDFKVTVPTGSTLMKITIEKKHNRIFYIKTTNTQNTEKLLLSTNNLIKDTISNGEIKPVEKNIDFRWGDVGVLVPQVGFKAYKFNVKPGEKYYLKGYIYSYSFVDYFNSATVKIDEGDKNYSEITIPNGVYTLLISESNKGDGNFKLFSSYINSKMKRIENLKEYGVVNATETIKNARWGGNDTTVSINNYNVYKYSVTEGEVFYLRGYTLKDRTSRIGFKYNDGTFSEYTEFQPQPLNFFKIIIPYNAVMMYITEIDERTFTFELYSTGIVKKTMELVEKRLEVFNDYPSYYNSHIEDKITQYQNIKYYTDSDSFIFLTDMHFKDNAMNAVGLINGIAKNTDLRKVFSGGDVVYAYGTTEECKDNAIKNIKYFNKLKDNIDFCAVRGNHDFTIKHNPTDTTGYTAPYDLAYNSVMSSVTDKAIKTDKLYYCLDNKAKKIRYVFVDTNDGGTYLENDAWGLKYGLSENQLNWLKNIALNVEEDWSVLVVGHIPCVVEIEGYHSNLDTLANILKDYKNKRNEFADYKGEFIAYICGHNHKDMDTLSDNTVFISTGCDACIKNDIFDRTYGTTREQLFDIFIIDKTNRKIKTIRVGSGNNRTFSY